MISIGDSPLTIEGYLRGMRQLYLNCNFTFQADESQVVREILVLNPASLERGLVLSNKFEPTSLRTFASEKL